MTMISIMFNLFWYNSLQEIFGEHFLQSLAGQFFITVQCNFEDLMRFLEQNMNYKNAIKPSKIIKIISLPRMHPC